MSDSNLPARGNQWLSLLFTFKGRIGRIGFVLTLVGTNALFYVIGKLVYAITGSTDIVEMTTVLLLLPISLWILFALSAKRWHDQATSGYYSLGLLVPSLNLLALFVLVVWPGTKDANHYGPPPKL